MSRRPHATRPRRVRDEPDAQAGRHPRRRDDRVPAPVGDAGLGERMAQLRDGLPLGPAPGLCPILGPVPHGELADALADHGGAPAGCALRRAPRHGYGVLTGGARSAVSPPRRLQRGPEGHRGPDPRAALRGPARPQHGPARLHDLLLPDRRLRLHRPEHAGARVSRHPAQPRGLQDHDLLEDRPAEDASGVLRSAEGRGDTRLHRHQPDGDRLAALAAVSARCSTRGAPMPTTR